MRSSAGAEDPEAGPSVAGLAGCLALLELEARALGLPLAATLIAAAGEAVHDEYPARRRLAPHHRTDDQR